MFGRGSITAGEDRYVMVGSQLFRQEERSGRLARAPDRQVSNAQNGRVQAFGTENSAIVQQPAQGDDRAVDKTNQLHGTEGGRAYTRPAQ